MTIEPQPAGPTFAHCALRGAHTGPNGLPMDTNIIIIYIYIFVYIYIYHRNAPANSCNRLASLAINPRRACADRVTVVVCMSVHTRYSGSTCSYKYKERYHRVKRQIYGNNKMAFFLKWSYSKVRAGFTYLGRGGHL